MARKSPTLPIGEWWTDMAIAVLRAATGASPDATTSYEVKQQFTPETTRTQTQLGNDLAKRIGRDHKFDHGMISKFMNRDVAATLEFIRAVCDEFTELPHPVLFPSTAEEAWAMMFAQARNRAGQGVDVFSSAKAPVVAMPKPKTARVPKSTGKARAIGRALITPIGAHDKKGDAK